MISAVFACACSLILKDTQCASDGDCAEKGGIYAGTVCREGACTTATPSRCASNAGCGLNQVCNRTSGICASLESVDCTRVVGDPSNDRSILVGTILKRTGSDLGGSPSIQAGIEYAREEIVSATGGGLPETQGGDPRPIVLVACDQVANPQRAAHYLVDTIGVHAIIGASNSGTTTDIATKVAVPNDVLLMSPTATSPSLTDLSDNGLVWRASPSDTLQGNVMALVYPMLQDRVVAANPAAQKKVRVALATKGDAYGKGLRDVLVSKLSINGAPANPLNGYFLAREYGDTDTNPNYDFSGDINAITAFRPDVVILGGTSEALAILRALEAASVAPLYLLSDGLVNPDTSRLVDALDGDAGSSLRDRVLGVIPGNPRSATYQAFRINFASSPDRAPFDPTNAAFGYDSLYLVAYAIVASHGLPITGGSIRDGLKKITGKSGIEITFGENQVNAAIGDLLSDKQIQVQGASGPLDFNPDTGDPVDDIDVEHLCIPIGGQAGAWTSSGLLYDAVKAGLDGAIAACP